MNPLRWASKIRDCSRLRAPPDAKASGGALAAEQDFFTGGAGEKMDGKFFPRLRPRELCEAALGKALPQKNAEEKGPKRQAVCLNAGAALYIAGKAETMEAGVRMAEELIDSGAALKKLDEFIACSNE